jgi:hypothetical protein
MWSALNAAAPTRTSPTVLPSSFANSTSQRQGRPRWRPGRRNAKVVEVAFGATAAVLFVIGGELAWAFYFAALALAELAALTVAPRLRPDMVARSLEASRAVVGTSE